MVRPSSPDAFTRFVVLRGLLTAFSLYCFFSSYFKNSTVSKHSTGFSIALVLSIACSISYMVFELGGFESPYYAGINLVMLAAGILFIWKVSQSLLTFGAICASYVLPNIFGESTGNYASVITNNFFLFSTAVIVTIAQYFNFRTNFNQFVTNHILDSTKKNLEKAHEELKKLDQFKSQFFANITHELRTPLTMILAPLEGMVSGELGGFKESQIEYFRTMFRNALKLMKLINDLLDLTKLEDSRIRLRIEETNIVEYIKGLAAEIKSLTDRKKITLSFEAERPEIMLFIDRERFERVIINILSNAAKFTGDSGAIRVIIRESGEDVVIECADTGIGIDKQQIDKIFTRFYQADGTTTRKYGGTGIGLALVKELVELHCGKIEVESEEGKGTTMRIVMKKGDSHFPPEVLDRRKARKDTPKGKREEDKGVAEWTVKLIERKDYRFLDVDEATERRIIQRDDKSSTGAFKVLVVEDNPDIVRLLHFSLRESYTVFAADNGKKGLDIARKEIPSLIISDLMMPEMDGLEMTRHLKTDPATKHIPILMLTAKGDIEDKIIGLP
ncbi:MAG: response regulator, partial [Deltaproteobacteria bacterium]|nr:response regulator [Deltaproteobacteria bacterium]